MRHKDKRKISLLTYGAEWVSWLLKLKRLPKWRN